MTPHTFMRFRLILLLSALLGLSDAAAQQTSQYSITPAIEELLCELDSLIATIPEITADKERSIAEARNRLYTATNPESRYWRASELYDQFCAYNSDSALVYADMGLKLAQTIGRPDLADDMELNRAYIFSATGLLDEAANCLDKVDRNRLSTTMLWKYCDRALFLDTHRDQYIGTANRRTAYSAVVDSLLQQTIPHLTVEDPHYLWFVGWGHLKDSTDAKRVIPQIKHIVDHASMTTRLDAMNAWVLGKLYEYSGDYNERFRYLILSAMADIRASNKEIASLEEVADILYNLGELDRANSYVTYSIACANAYKSRVRLGQLANLQEKTLGALQQRSVQEEAKSRHYLVGLVGILVVLLLALVFIIQQMRQLSRSRHELNIANDELNKRVQELQTTREDLREANAKLSAMYDSVRTNAEELAAINVAKEKYIANIFTICSNYINKLDDFRINIYRMLVAHRFDELLKQTKSPELSHSEIKELYSTFDSIFLEIYPDFVNDFNELLRPEECIEPRSDGSLTTELRIYALVRLGLNDSVKIARFLHVSPQTVYNTRMRTRNKAIVPKETFAEKVKSLGKASF